MNEYYKDLAHTKTSEVIKIINGLDKCEQLRELFAKKKELFAFNYKLEAAFIKKIGEFKKLKEHDRFFTKFLEDLEEDFGDEMYNLKLQWRIEKRRQKEIEKGLRKQRQKKRKEGLEKAKLHFANKAKFNKDNVFTIDYDIIIPVTTATQNLVEIVEYEAIKQALYLTEFNRTQASKILGISLRTLRNKLHKYVKRGWANKGIVGYNYR
jgi:hypothetical protein